jgi:5'-3' exonuclease
MIHVHILVDMYFYICICFNTSYQDYVDSGFEDAQFYVDYILFRARSLRDMGVEPILVFDGKRNNLKVDNFMFYDLIYICFIQRFGFRVYLY